MIMLNKIVYPTDFSPAAEAAFDTAQRLARDSNALLLIVHVFEPSSLNIAPAVPPLTVAPPQLPGNTEEAARQARQHLEQVIPDDQKIRYEHRFVEGVPTKEIPKLADEVKPDLIVMGTHGRTGLSRLLMGSVAETVVRHANCPVLTLREPVAGSRSDQETNG